MNTASTETRTFDSPEAALENARALLENGQISQADFERISASLAGGPDDETAAAPEKRLSGAQRAKKMVAALRDQIADRDRQIAQLEASLRDAQARNTGSDQPPADIEQLLHGDQEAAQAADQERGAREAQMKDEWFSKRVTDHSRRVAAAKEFISDYDAIMQGMGDVQVSHNTLAEILASDKSELISYHFANHPDDLRKFNAMASRDQIREIGRLEATLKMPEPKKATSAPPPMSRLRGGTVPRDQGADLNAWLDKKYGKDRSK